MNNETRVQPKKIVSRISRGFTLVELLVVIVIIGILGAIINNTIGGSGIAASAKAEQKYEAAIKAVNTWAAVAQYMNVAKHPLDSNMFRAAAHDALDVLIPLDPRNAIATEFSARYASNAPVRSLEQFQVITEPTTTARGVYAIGDAKNLVTISYDTVTQNMTVSIAEVPAEEVRALMDKYYPSSTTETNYSATARTSSNIQYTALSGSTHTLRIVRKI